MASPADPAAQLVFAPNVLHNQSLTSVKFLSSCFAGAVAGVLGLENWHGFALFAASVLSTSFMIYAINCKGKPAKYLSGGLGELVNPGQDNIFTFILVWTLFYGAFDLLFRRAEMVTFRQASSMVRDTFSVTDDLTDACLVYD